MMHQNHFSRDAFATFASVLLHSALVLGALTLQVLAPAEKPQVIEFELTGASIPLQSSSKSTSVEQPTQKLNADDEQVTIASAPANQKMVPREILPNTASTKSVTPIEPNLNLPSSDELQEMISSSALAPVSSEDGLDDLEQVLEQEKQRVDQVSLAKAQTEAQAMVPDQNFEEAEAAAEKALQIQKQELEARRQQVKEQNKWAQAELAEKQKQQQAEQAKKQAQAAKADREALQAARARAEAEQAAQEQAGREARAQQQALAAAAARQQQAESQSGRGDGVRALGEVRQLPGNKRPQYDLEDRLESRQGEIVFHVWIDSRGLPQQFQLKQGTGHRSLDLKTLSALKKWKFVPGQEGWVEIPFRWDLKGGPQEMPTTLRRFGAK